MNTQATITPPCELPELPEPMKVPERRPHSPFQEGYARGWNECLDRIKKNQWKAKYPNAEIFSL